jgi:steroid delta-isomerase-like uncharacterized protein
MTVEIAAIDRTSNGMNDPDRNRALVRRYLDDVLGRGDLDAVEEIFAREIVFHGPKGVLRGVFAVQDWVQAVRLAFDEFSVTLDRMIAEEQRVVSRVTIRGFHVRPLAGMPASMRRLVLPMVIIFRMENEKIVDAETLYDTMTFTEILGQAGPMTKKI